MRLLPYCITEIEPIIQIPATGVQGMPIEALIDSGLRCLFSGYNDTTNLVERPIRETAVQFNRVLQQIFRQVTIIPFRFPTVLADQSELFAFLREHREEYGRALPRLRDKVQVEVRVSYQQAPHALASAKQSGLDYMRKQQVQLRALEAAVKALREAGQPWIESWHERQVLSGVRCYALVTTSAMSTFMEKVGSVEIAPELSARVTGPWPATEFLRE